MPTNYWSFAYGIIKGFRAKVGSNISTILEMMGIQSSSIDFFPLFHYIKRGKNQCLNFEDLSFQG